MRLLQPLHFLRLPFQRGKMFLFCRKLVQQGILSNSCTLSLIQRTFLLLRGFSFRFRRTHTALVRLNQHGQVLQQLRMFRQEILLFRFFRQPKKVLHGVRRRITVRLTLLPEQFPRAFQQFTVAHINGIVKQLSKDLVFLVAVCLQKFLNLPLRQHHNLFELLRIQPQKLSTAFRHLRRAGQRVFFRLPKRCIQKPIAKLIFRASFFSIMNRALCGVIPSTLPEREAHRRIC